MTRELELYKLSHTLVSTWKTLLQLLLVQL